MGFRKEQERYGQGGRVYYGVWYILSVSSDALTLNENAPTSYENGHTSVVCHSKQQKSFVNAANERPATEAPTTSTSGIAQR